MTPQIGFAESGFFKALVTDKLVVDLDEIPLTVSAEPDSIEAILRVSASLDKPFDQLWFLSQNTDARDEIAIS